MKRLRSVLGGGGIALTASLLLARIHPFGDAGLVEPQPRQALMEDASVPAEVRATLTAKCADCHSMATRLPAYDRIAVRLAPMSWMIEHDIVEGRKDLNLSAWDRYTPDQRQILVAKIVEEAKQRKMPLVQYRAMHWNASVEDADVAAFTHWMQTTGPGQSSAAAVSTGTGDATRGQDVFKRRCTGCHALDSSREGPRLRDVYGRTSGQIAGFPYSPALVKAHVIWNETTLEQWLTDPDSLVPGNNMDFRVPNAQERKDLISFLRRARSDSRD